MRACAFVLAMIAITPPAFAREPSGKSHQLTPAHHAKPMRHADRARHQRQVRRVVREAPIESGYAMPQSFASPDALETPFDNSSMPTNAATTPDVAAPVERRAVVRAAPAPDGALDAMIARHAAANGLPVELVHRVVIRESRYNPRARNGGNLGLMQIKYATARGVGYAGAPAGLLDAETNLTYAVRYLAGAYRAAGGNASRAVAYYASGYHGRGVARAPVAVASVPPWEAQSQVMPVALRDDMVVPVEYPGRRQRLAISLQCGLRFGNSGLCPLPLRQK